MSVLGPPATELVSAAHSPCYGFGRLRLGSTHQSSYASQCEDLDGSNYHHSSFRRFVAHPDSTMMRDTERRPVRQVKNVSEEDEEVGGKIPEKINWFNVIGFIILHVVAIRTVGLLVRGEYMASTVLLSCVLTVLGGIGNTVGAHRLWAHKSYKANTAMRFFLVLCQTLMVQNSVWQWVAWHRAHHKYSETRRDPHNAKRGFFYSHIGWLLLYDPKSLDYHVKSIPMEDLDADPVVMWQHRNYNALVLILGLVIPTVVPWYFWDETIWNAMSVGIFLRLTYNYHTTFLVNSAAHLWGPRPYDKDINPTENKLVSILALGEGWHNYHHVFPWDYRASELGLYLWNPSTAIIEFCARMGWAHDLKTVSSQVVAERMKRTGDGSWPHAPFDHRGSTWGWDDRDTPEDCIKLTEILYPEEG